MFAWCLQRYAGVDRAQADARALDAYPYESPGDPHRGLTFHDEAWHWAMLTIHGGMYWLRDRTLEVPSEAYRLESESFDRATSL